MLSFCKNNNVFISNGRTGKDKYIGANTNVKGNTVIDYFICSPSVMCNIHDFEPVISDIHCVVNCILKCKYFDDKIEKRENYCDINGTEKFNWNSNVRDNFIQSCKRKANELLSMVDTNQDINVVNEKLVELFTNCARDNNLVVKSKRRKGRIKKPNTWFNMNCYHKRRHYSLCRNRSIASKSNVLKDEMKVACKAYKSEIRKSKLEEKRAFIKKLRNLKKCDPKHYWKLLGDKKKHTSNISINVLKEHFKAVLNKSGSSKEYMCSDIEVDPNFTEFYDGVITKEEILNAIKKLKTNKAHGIDGVLNEYIKNTADVLIEFWVKLFNRVYNSGEVPAEWSKGIIITLYKGNGTHCDPKNYRGITLLSCIGKLFTSVLNNGLTLFCNAYDVIKENQAGFRKEYSTTHHIFTLKCLIDLCLSRKEKMYCAYIDYATAFDKIDRITLWNKLLKSNIGGKLLKVIQSMYVNIKSCVSLNIYRSDFFLTNIGIRQGENL